MYMCINQYYYYYWLLVGSIQWVSSSRSVSLIKMAEGEVVPLDPRTVQRKHLSLPLTCLSLSLQYPNDERIKGRRQRIAAHTNFSAAISLSVHSGHIGILLTPGSGSASLKYKDKGSTPSASHSFFPLALLLVDFPAGMISLISSPLTSC